jgi:DNA-binding beta-propeller fold protein YncE
VIVWELLTGKQPFAGISKDDVRAIKARADFVFPVGQLNRNIPHLIALMHACLHNQPDNRLTSKQIVEHFHTIQSAFSPSSISSQVDIPPSPQQGTQEQKEDLKERRNERSSLFRSQLSFQMLGNPEQQGNNDGLFNGPQSVAFDGEGRVIVADGGNHRIQVFNGNGDFLFKFGNHGNRLSQFSRPTGVTTTSDGRIIVSDWGNHRISVWTSNGQFLTTFGDYGSQDDQFKDAQGVTVNSRDEIIVVDGANHRVQVFSSNGQFVRKFGCEGDNDGQFLSPFGVCVDKHDNIILSEIHNHNVQVFSSNGQFLFKFGEFGNGEGQLYGPHGVATTRNGDIVVADSENKRLSVFSESGVFLRHLPLPYDPYWLTVSDDNDVIISFTGQHCVGRVKL